MRTIKFRAWDKELNKFNDDFGTYFLPYTDLNNTVTENIILMQFTGLTDRAGVEIYEGDILDCPDYRDVVIWDADKFGFWLEDFTNDELYKDNFTRCEIIGNIYENPELLKENSND